MTRSTTGARTTGETRFGRHRLLSYGVLIVLFMIGFFQRFAPATFSEAINADFHSSASALGLFAAANFWMYTVMQVPAGLLVDRYGTRACTAVGAVVTAAGSVVLGLAPGIAVASVGPLLVGLGTCAVFVGLMKNNGYWFPEHRYGLITGLTMLLGNVGSVLSEGPSARLLAIFSWRSIFLVVGGLALLMAVLAVMFVRNRPSDVGLPELAHTVRETERGGESGQWVLLLRNLRGRQLWAVFWCAIGTNGTFYAFSGLWGVPLLTDGFGLSNGAASLYTTVSLVVYGVGSFVIGFVSDRLGRRKPLIVLSSMAAVAGWAGLAWLPWTPGWSGMVLYVLVGGAGAQVVVAFAAMKEAVPSRSAAAALAVINSGVFLASGIVQPLFGRILDWVFSGDITGGRREYALADYRVALIVPVVISVVGLAAATRVRETHCRNYTGP